MSAPSERELADVAKVLHFPDTIVESRYWTYGVADLLDSWHVTCDRWQEDLSQIVLGEDENGKIACRVGGVRLSSARQIGKTYWIGHLAFALCCLVPGFRVIWTAQHKNTALATLRSLEELSEGNPEIAAHIKRTERGKLFAVNGSEAIARFNNGSTFEVGARESNFGQGRSNIDMVVIDEAQFVSEDAIRRLFYTMNVSKWGLFIHTGNPPAASSSDETKAEAFSRFRQRVLDGKQTKGAYIEIAADEKLVDQLDLSAPDQLVLDERFWEAVGQANPAYPLRVDAQAIEAAVNELSPESLLTDTFGIWRKSLVQFPALARELWDAQATDSPPEDGVEPNGIGINADPRTGAISIVGAWVDGEHRHVELLFAHPHEDEALRWLVDSVPKSMPIKFDSGGVAGHIGETLIKEHRYRKASAYTATEASRGNAAWMAAALEGRLSHDGNAVLSAAVANSTRVERKSGTGWFFERINQAKPIGPVIAGCAALIAAGSKKHKTYEASF